MEALQCFLNKYLPNYVFCCPQNVDWRYNFESKIIINIYYNKKQKDITDSAR